MNEMAVLIPSEQGKYSNIEQYEGYLDDVCLNPFGTGKVFKQHYQIMPY